MIRKKQFAGDTRGTHHAATFKLKRGVPNKKQDKKHIKTNDGG
jgi:hypothetical protein